METGEKKQTNKHFPPKGESLREFWAVNEGGTVLKTKTKKVAGVGHKFN